MQKQLDQFVWKAIPYWWVFAIIGGVLTETGNRLTGWDECRGVSLTVFVTIPLIVLYVVVNELKKKSAEQQNQIDELKRELENRKQK